ncbi:neprilysin-1-like isoform X2 [Orussus abietinus]|nr:neprilysin-1-like isoform X2 [Orussus abietinus]
MVYLTIVQEVKTQTPPPIPGTSQTSEVCSTNVCKNAASDILKYMDMRVDPCVDFYEYFCGRWINNHPLPHNKLYNDQIDELTRKIKQRRKGRERGK